MDTPLLSVKDLKVHFKHDSEIVRAVDGIDFEINENEVVGLVGESGSGKTVTALSIMKLLPKRDCFVSGEIIFRSAMCEKENNLLGLSEKEIIDVRGSKIAMVFQEPFTSLNPVLRVGEQIDEAILMHKKVSKKDAQNQSLALLEKVKIKSPERIYNSYPHLLSGGERQRAMIAMVIALHPKFLIADEPTTALDVTIQAEILELILGLKKALNMSVLFITHDFGIINKVADRVLVMKDGKIIEKGQKVEVLSSPKENYTKRLLEAVPRITVTQKKSKRVEEKTVVAIKDLNKSFPVEKGIFEKEKERIRALHNISLEIKEGETLGLVGESGSGKTTLGKLLIGLLEADSGKILIGDSACEDTRRGQVSISGLVPRRNLYLQAKPRRNMQIVFQDPYSSLDPRMRMQDIVLEGPAIRGVTRDQKEAVLRDVLFKVHLNYKDRLKYPHQFSGGQRQRIAIARSLAVNPTILILDEPVSSLDVIIQSEILNLLKELQKELSLTYIFISHDLRAVGYMADEVAVMHKGEIVEYAPRDQIYTTPKHPYTKRLLSSILQL